MPSGGEIILVLSVVLAIVVFIIPMAYKRTEGYKNVYDYTRGDYIEHGKNVFNNLANTGNPLKPSFVNSLSEGESNAANYDILSATITSNMEPNPKMETLLGVVKPTTNYKVSPGNSILADARRCENVKGRATCARLGDPDFRDCGVCIAGGTPQTYTNPGKHIGGMLLLGDDRDEAIELAKGTGRDPVFTPTVGTCPPGYFVADRATCEKAVNRADCKESGETGGFSGKTIEGRSVANEKCAQVPSSGDNVFIYDPKNRVFSCNLRVITPTGTGTTEVIVMKRGADNNWAKIGSGSSDMGGKEFLVPVNGVKELDDVMVQIFQEAPQRRGGKPEVFQYQVDMRGGASGRYNMSQEESEKACSGLGARLATKEEVQNAWRKGAQSCACGWTTSELVFPMQAEWRDGDSSHDRWCGGVNLNSCGNKGLGKTWCYGVKPPQSTEGLGLASYVKTTVVPWFASLGSGADPSQEDTPSIWSLYGPDYQAPYARGVILQWEGIDAARTRVVPFEPTITMVNGMDPSSIAGDGSKTFKILRRQGTFRGSTIIPTPKPRKGSPMLTNQFWIWSNQSKADGVTFVAKVPGTLAQPFYSEDAREVSTAGTIITNVASLELLRTSPCLRDGEVSGKYSFDCLTSLFISAGGDPGRGKLATTGVGLTQLNKLGDMDAISEYLANLYSLATTGRDAEGNSAGGGDSRKRVIMINDAAQKLFGFDISTPCEDILEDAKGNVVIVTKTSAIDADCLNYLWVNAGSDKNRGQEDPTSASKLKYTYTDIRDRFSGLLKAEGSQTSREKYPFRTCQSTGSMAPINAKGGINVKAVAAAISKGGIPQIQDYYDKLHRTANNLSMSKSADNEKAFATAVEQCYGVMKAPEEADEKACGVVARYVRVLPTGIYASHEQGNLCMQIPQIQVFDANGTEVAKGKPTSSGTKYPWTDSGPEKAVDGKAYPHGHDSEYHDDCNGPDNQFWMVDLGRDILVQKIVYYLRTDCCKQRQIGTPVQLLNSAKEIVAQKQIYQDVWPNWGGNTSTLIFAKNDIKPEYTIDQLTPGLRFSAMTATSFDRYLRHSGYAFWAWGTNNQPGNSQPPPFPQDTTFIFAPANNGKPGYISITSVNFPNHFLRHAGFRCYLNNYDPSQVYLDDSSFKIIPALNGDKRMISIQSSNFPDHYLSTSRADAGQIWITPVNTGSAYDTQRASWMIMRPNV